MQKILSYIFPIRLKKYYSKVSGQLEINMIDGKKRLDARNSNYSYGSLQKILHQGLIEVKFPNGIERVLVLGLGGGSIIQTIRDDFKSNIFIELVEIDPKMIAIAVNEFEIIQFDNISIIESDASDYLKICKDTFDLIVVDIFITNTIPQEFTDSKFIKSLIPHLSQNGKILYNTMKHTMGREVFNEIKEFFSKEGLRVKVLANVEGSNDIIIAEK